MVQQLARKLAAYSARAKLIQEADAGVYSYGYELLISTAANSAALIAVSAFLGAVPGALLYMAGFIPIRLTAGGYHAKRHWSCAIVTNALFLVFAAAVRAIPESCMLAYSLACCMFFPMAVWRLSPVAALNKPMGAAAAASARNRSLAIAALDVFIALAHAALPLPTVGYLAYYVSGAAAAGALMIAGAAQHRRLGLGSGSRIAD
jgi:accessory gene regulator B